MNIIKVGNDLRKYKLCGRTTWETGVGEGYAGREAPHIVTRPCKQGEGTELSCRNRVINVVLLIS